MLEAVLRALARVRPALLADGGDVRLVSVQDGIVRVRLEGACDGCPQAQGTLRFAIEAAIREEAPEVRAVVATNLSYDLEEFWKARAPRPAPVSPYERRALRRAAVRARRAV